MKDLPAQTEGDRGTEGGEWTARQRAEGSQGAEMVKSLPVKLGVVQEPRLVKGHSALQSD